VGFEGRRLSYDLRELDDLVLAYATTVHKAQGSEYPTVVLPVHTQHYPLLQRNLLYTAITRASRRLVLVGTRRALAIAAGRRDSGRRVTLLAERLRRNACDDESDRGPGQLPLL
jgi:exodeoxyribonuclease V alpha subunit